MEKGGGKRLKNIWLPIIYKEGEIWHSMTIGRCYTSASLKTPPEPEGSNGMSRRLCVDYLPFFFVF